MAFGFFDSSADPSQPDSYDAIQRKRKLAEMLMAQGMSTAPITHWTQGLANVAKTAVGAYKERKADQAEGEADKEWRKLLSDTLGGTAATTTGGAAMGLQPVPAGAPAVAAPQPGGSPPSMGPVTGDKQAFIEQMMPHAMKVSQETGIDPRIVISQAALESGWGKKAPGNNYFGIKSHGTPGGQTLNTTEVVNGQPVRTADSFRQYADMGASAAGYADFLKKNPRYQPMLQAQGLQPQIDALAKSGYATDPAYGQKIASIAQGIPMPQGQPAQVASAQPMAPPVPGAMPTGQPMALAPPQQQPQMPSGMPAGAAPVPPQRQQLAQALTQPQPQPSAPAGQPDQMRALMVRALTDPRLSPQQRQQAMAMAQMLQKDDSVSTVDLGTSIGIMDKRGNLVRQIPKQTDDRPVTLGEGQRLVDPRTGAAIGSAPEGNKVSREVAAREAEAKRLGLDPADPRAKQFILTGNYPKEPDLTVTDKNAIIEADEFVAANQSTIGALQKAKDLSKKAMGFTGAGTVATVGSMFGNETAKATLEMNQVVTEQALAGLKSTFGGNPTEGERKILLDIQGSSNLPNDVRQKIFDRAIEAAQRRLEFNKTRAAKLRGGTYYKPGPGGTPDTPLGAPAGGATGGWSVEEVK